MNLKSVFSGILCSFVCTACNVTSGDLPVVTLVEPDGRSTVEIAVEIADDADERKTGLMHRESLAENQGMLFVYERESRKTFWMKSTLIPLDILFFNEDGVLVDVQTMQPCKKDPCKIYKSKQPAKYALEVNAGYANQNGIRPDWRFIPPN